MDSQGKDVFLTMKAKEMNQFCIEKCLAQSLGQTFSIRQENCLNYCTVKIINAYSFMYDVAGNEGIATNDNLYRMKGPF